MSDFCTTDTLAYGEELTAPYEDQNDKVLNTITYTGHEKDYETNLTYMMARYYSQGYGRFFSPDPGYDYDQLDQMSWNLYSYVRGNPVNYADENGAWRYPKSNKHLAFIVNLAKAMLYGFKDGKDVYAGCFNKRARKKKEKEKENE